MASAGTPSPKKYQSRLSLQREKGKVDTPPKEKMSCPCPFVKIVDLKIGQQNAKVKCRVVSKTEVTQTAYGSMFSAIIMDETAVIRLVCWGTAICAMFYDNFKVDKIYILDKIGVKAATQITYTWVANTAQITLNKVSKAHEVDDDDTGTCLEDKIPLYKHHFTALDKCQESGKIVDVIGGLYEIGEMITIKTSKASTKREIKIIDQSNNKVTITMWNMIAEKFIIAVEKLEDVVVVFGGTKISTFSREDGEIFLDSFDDTIVSINPDIPEATVLASWLAQQSHE